MLGDDVIEHFRAQAEAQGTGYRETINGILREAAARDNAPSSENVPLTVATLRRVLREELHSS